MNPLKELNTIVSDIITADSHDSQLEAGQKLLAYTVCTAVDEEFRELAENIAMLMIQKEGRDLHLEFMDDDLQKTSTALHEAKHDPLTGLASRGLFYETLDAAFEKSQKEGNKLALILLDLDNFKPVNDTHGHDAGDALLSQAALRIKDATGDAGMSARLGGDEFVVLLPDLQDEKEAFTIAQKILLRLKKPFKLASATVFIDSSLGISFLDETTQESRALLKHADLAMYEAKKAGRGRYVAYTEKH
ncbi:MAG: GGDEF domain-containing protein [Desulfobacterium sp.]|nr:GGDEF domain-containing protein [Desulfobacterium sp.]